MNVLWGIVLFWIGATLGATAGFLAGAAMAAGKRADGEIVTNKGRTGYRVTE